MGSLNRSKMRDMPYPFANNPVERFMLEMRALKQHQKDHQTAFDTLPKDGGPEVVAAKTALLDIRDRINALYETQPAPRDYDVYITPLEERLFEFERTNPRPVRASVTCAHANHEKRLRTARGGATNLWLQCVDCGALLSSLAKSDYPCQSFPAFDEELLQAEGKREADWQARRQALLASERGEAARTLDTAAFDAAYEVAHPRPFDPYECSHQKSTRTRKRSATSDTVVLQCDRCGKHVCNISKKGIPCLDALPPFDPDKWNAVANAADTWSVAKYKARHLAEREFHELRRQRIASGEFSEVDTSRFGTYYTTPEWQRARSRVFDRDDHTCQRCTRPATDAHHVTYDRLGCENDLDLISLCAACHVLVHEHQDHAGPGFRLTPNEIRALKPSASPEP